MWSSPRCSARKNSALPPTALVTLGCIMMRVCHLNTCPVGVATQNPELRKKFTGDPAHVVNFMRFIAQEMRELMAELGFRTINEMVGRTDRLEMRASGRALESARPGLLGDSVSAEGRPEVGRYCQIPQDHGLENALDNQVLLDLASPLSSARKRSRRRLPIRNANRVVGTILGSEVTRRYGRGRTARRHDPFSFPRFGRTKFWRLHAARA